MNSRLPALAAAGAILLFQLVSAAAQTPATVTRDKILAQSSRWQENYDRYDPDPVMIEALKSKLGEGLRIDVYLGLWCPDSRNNVPPFLKILDRLDARVPVRYFALERKASRDDKYYFEEKKVERVPTFIVYRNDEEIGRIVENPQTGMLEDLWEILSK